MTNKSVTIIGAGIAGLSAGCYLQMNGYNTRIFEMSNIFGGLCASWSRKNYNINGGFHSLIGCQPDSDFYHIWKELGIIPKLKFVHFDNYICFEAFNGKKVIMHSNLDKLEAHLLDVAPEDHKLIEKFMNAARKLVDCRIPTVLIAPELYGVRNGLKALSMIFPHIGLLRKWMKISMSEFASCFKSTPLREIFTSLWFPESPVLFFLFMLSMMQRKETGYPVGGPMEFAKAIERRYINLGGEIHYGSEVSEIIVKNDRATGIKFTDGSECHEGTIVSAADGYATVFKLLKGKYITRKIKQCYNKYPIFPPLISMSFGLDRSFNLMNNVSSGINFPLEKHIVLAGEERLRLGIRTHDFDPTAAPTGKTLARCLIPSNFPYWEPLMEDRTRYREEKKYITEKVSAMLEKRFPGFGSHTDMCDTATPLTYYDYTGNWQGSHQGWMLTSKTGTYRMKKTLPGLSNFYMIGQWVEPGGGVPLAAVSGRNIAQILCKRDKKSFITTESEKME
ncbi:phytoene desaturase family protein [Thermodesulfobacteriota bacterium]